MPSKKKSKQKKSKNSSATTPWDDLDLETLEQEVSELTEKRNKALQERIQIQTEYDAVRSYYCVTQQQLDTLDNEIKLKVYEADQKKEDTLEEMKSYEEKIQQLNYDFQGKVQIAQERKRQDFMNEKQRHDKNIAHGEDNISAAREELMERQIVYLEEIRQEKARLENNLRDVKKSLHRDLEDLEKKCELGETRVENDLILKRQVDLRLMEEQKNFHIYELERTHKELCNNSLTQNSNTSTNNASKISKLEEECQRVSDLIHKTEERSKELQDENNRLIGPLEALTTKVRCKANFNHSGYYRLPIQFSIRNITCLSFIPG